MLIAFLIALVASLAFLGVISCILRQSARQARMAAHISAIGLLLSLCVGTLFFLWSLSSTGSIGTTAVRTGFLCFCLLSSIYGGWLQIYNLADRGLSLRILIDLELSVNPVTAKALIDAYACGKGLSWMYDKRLNDLLHLGLVSEEMNHSGQPCIRITQAGMNLSKKLSFLRRCFHINLFSNSADS